MSAGHTADAPQCKNLFGRDPDLFTFYLAQYASTHRIKNNRKCQTKHLLKTGKRVKNIKEEEKLKAHKNYYKGNKSSIMGGHDKENTHTRTLTNIYCRID